MRKPNLIYLNADIGEANSADGIAIERSLLEHVTAVSIATGGHAGDADSIRAALTAANQHGCLIGAHPSYPDRDGFGRRPIEISRESLRESILTQLELFSGIADELGVDIRFIKAHGALYHQIAHDVSFASWIVELCHTVLPNTTIVLPIGCLALNKIMDDGIDVIVEGFCDRTYEPDGTLRDRSVEGALITSTEQAATQAIRLVQEQDCDMLCVHSDTPGSLSIAKRVRAILELL